MTHDELLARIAKLSITPETNIVPSELATALMAVVELHKPDSTGGCNACEQWTNEGAYQLHYPCPTIQAIIEELK